MPSEKFIHDTESAKFIFNKSNVPKDPKNPEYVVIGLLESGVGSVLCKQCEREYPVSQMQKEPIGQGSSPFTTNIKSQKGGILKNLFSGRQMLPGMSGGVCFKCPKGHELIAVRTWIT